MISRPPPSPLLLWPVAAFLFAWGCGGAMPGGATALDEAPVEVSAEDAFAEETGADAADTEDAAETCRLPPSAPSAGRQIARFHRWLLDQTVGRRVVLEAVEPVCGDRAGMLVVAVTVSGESGGLLSLARALEVYYPGSSWRPEGHERLAGRGFRLRLVVEVGIPVGAEPRPRCTWDPAVSCPSGPSR